MGVVQSTVSSPEAVAVVGTIAAGAAIAAAYGYRIVARGDGTYAGAGATTEENSKSEASLRQDEKSGGSMTDGDSKARQNAAGPGASTATKKASKKRKGAGVAAEPATAAASSAAADKEFEQVIAAARRENADAIARAAIASVRRSGSSEPEKAVPGGFVNASSGSAVLLQPSPSGSISERKATRKKKGNKSSGDSCIPELRTVPAISVSSPLQIDMDVSLIELPPLASSVTETTPAPMHSASKKKRKSVKGATGDSSTFTKTSAGLLASTSTSANSLGQSVMFSDVAEDESWTRVSTRKRTQAADGPPNASTTKVTANSSKSSGGEGAMTEPELMTSDTNLTTSHTEPDEAEDEAEDEDEDKDEVNDESAQVPEQGAESHKTFVEQKVSHTRKTGVEDMEEVPLQPTLARAMHVKSEPGTVPTQGRGDYEEYAHGDDGTSADGDADDVWEEVKSKKRTKSNRAGTSSAVASSIDSLPARASDSTPPDALSRNQRKYLKRREASKAEKEAQEKDRLERLAQHKRDLEQARITEQYKSYGQSGKKNASGGMTASVDSAGKLVWD